MTKKQQIIELWNSGQFRTQNELASHLGVKPQYINNVLREKEKSSEPLGEFDLREAFAKDQKKIWRAFMDAVNNGQINANALRTLAQIAGKLVERREDTIKVDLTPADKIRIGAEYRDALIAEFRDTGYCSICGFNKALRNQPLLPSEPEQPEDREMAAVAVPARPD